MRASERKNVIEFGWINDDAFVRWRSPFAKVLVIRGKEQFEDGQRLTMDVWQFTCDYRDVDGADASMTVRYDRRMLDVKSIRPDEQDRTVTVIECWEIGQRGSVPGGEPDPEAPVGPGPSSGTPD